MEIADAAAVVLAAMAATVAVAVEVGTLVVLDMMVVAGVAGDLAEAAVA